MSICVEEETQKLFQALDIPLEFVSEAIKALEKHSQNSIFDNAKNVQLVGNEEWKITDEIFKELDLPIRTSMTVQEISNLVH